MTEELTTWRQKGICPFCGGDVFRNTWGFAYPMCECVACHGEFMFQHGGHGFVGVPLPEMRVVHGRCPHCGYDGFPEPFDGAVQVKCGKCEKWFEPEEKLCGN